MQSIEADVCVLKFGSSVLESEADYRCLADEAYRHIRAGEKVVLVLSAIAGETDALFAQAERVGGDAAAPALVARLARIGELRSAALMALALGRIGVRAAALDPHEMALVAEGAPLDSNLVALDAAAVAAKLADHEAIVVPGFIAGHAEHGVVTLGRGGTDLSAVFFAAALGAKRVRLLKDVDGVYAEDPAVNPRAERYGAIDYDTAAEASAGLIQPKAIAAAKAAGIAIEIAALGEHEATVIAAGPAIRRLPLLTAPLRVALLGHGAVGAGVAECIDRHSDRFALGKVLVRHLDGRDPARFTDDLDEALAGDPDVVIELIGGSDAADILSRALRRGAHVVTANKAVVAAHYDAFHAAATAGGSQLVFSGAVGGGAPVLEAAARLHAGPGLVAVEGVMNGTANHLFGRLAAGWPLDRALIEARALGFAEADPSADVDGYDAAAKLAILARACFGAALAPERIPRQSLRATTPETAQAALARGEVLKQVGRCRVLPNGTLAAGVTIESLPLAHPLAGANGAENRFRLTDRAGRVHTIFGQGAGRWPTAAAVFADLMDVRRRHIEALGEEPIRLSA
ncbi:homoserine dehydrogenase [Allosphingosinicella indica]|uniref:Homoserine dehydrogenase n=1 Tax=Allosphingosinicella indica TaxID=941907 RepID=A0A1X7FZR3_9SPHN|nr:homoserine dehydrogenase [Allosphingosinicella indica]SMF61595.1 homoserine dehydrogenase [Allosphingosinicella indica]